MSFLRRFWNLIRRLSGDDAYELYLAHFDEHHRSGAEAEILAPMTKAEFFRQWQEQKWSGIKRCC